jgi:hypothetical protein
MKWIELKHSLINTKNIESVDIIKMSSDNYGSWREDLLNDSSIKKLKYFIKIIVRYDETNKRYAIGYTETIEEAIENFDRITEFLSNNEQRVLRI